MDTRSRRSLPLLRLLLALGLGLLGAAWAQSPSIAVSAQDSLGRKVELTSPARRVISLSPEATEALFAAGVGSGIVGDTTYCDYPAEALKLAKIGGFSPDSISLEKIISLKPDLVVTGGRLHSASCPFIPITISERFSPIQ